MTVIASDKQERDWDKLKTIQVLSLLKLHQICEKYNIPCLNEESEYVPYFYGQKFKLYPQNEKDRINVLRRCSPENDHPNIDAHKIESHIVERFLLSL